MFALAPATVVMLEFADATVFILALLGALGTLFLHK
jgi:hypothetical protein